MAKKTTGVWGIEIGQTALKALHCITEGDEITADAFDYIEYPKILTSPEAVPEELVADALKTLLERNDSLNETVVISVPGQSGLSKFFKPPPVELKRLGDIVRYEARQQIPFDLDDVVWDYQLMPGSMIEEGFAAESEVGLFAMKREQAYRQLAPFQAADIEVDQVQLAPIALYNMIAYDRLHERLEVDFYDSSNPLPSVVLLSIGTDSSDLIITNGFRIWQRNMPIGGNHFTRQLTKDLKMTYAKAEHLKRNIREAVDPKLLIQTMRPVFNDLETEIQRSIGFFRSIEKGAEITEMLITGNTVKMPGLAAYLGKNLGFKVEIVDRFNRLGGEDVLAIPAFRDNIPTFAVCYGLCLQGLKKAKIQNTLIPKEIKTARLIRAKKPWTLAAIATMLVGMTAHYFFTEKSWETTHEDLWKSAQSEVSQTSTYSGTHVSTDETLKTRLEYLDKLGTEVAGDNSRRLKWLELLLVANSVVPRVDFPDGKMLGPKEKPYLDRQDIQIKQMDTRYFEDLKTWFGESTKTRYIEEMRNWAQLTKKPLPADLMTITGPEGAGWIVQWQCFHFYNDIDKASYFGTDHVRRILTDAFLTGKVRVPAGTDANGNPKFEEFTLSQYGITYPLLVDDAQPVKKQLPNTDFDPIKAKDQTPLLPGQILPEGYQMPYLEVLQMDFKFQFVWKEMTMEQRIEQRTKDEEAAAAAAAKEAEAAAQAPPAV
jgi:type IV pilus assembly protein PilM